MSDLAEAIGLAILGDADAQDQLALVRGTAQADAVKGPKTIKMYEGAEHELTYTAGRDRVAWLKEQLRLR